MNVIRSRLRILVLLISRIVMMVVICSVLRYAEIRGERSNIVINEVCSNNYSLALWKSKRKGTAEYEDERWRWMIFDLDITARDPAVNSFDESLNDLMKDPIIKNLAQSDEFKKQFEDRFFEIAENIFSYEKVNDELKEWGNNYRRQIIKTQKQFVSEEYDETRYWEYMKEIDRFFEQRPKYIFTYLENYIE